MREELDQVIAENEDLKTENERLKSLLDNSYETIISMAEGIAMLSHPNWAKMTEQQQQDVKAGVYSEWIERAMNDKYRR